MKEHYSARQKREILELRQKLFELSTNPESSKSKQIVFEQKMLKYQLGTIGGGSFLNKMKEMGFSRDTKQFNHFENDSND